MIPFVWLMFVFGAATYFPRVSFEKSYSCHGRDMEEPLGTLLCLLKGPYWEVKRKSNKECVVIRGEAS